MAKFGEEFAREMLDRGRREFGAVIYGDGQVAQPTYPLRPGFAAEKEAAEQTAQEEPSALDKKLTQVSREEPGQDERGRDEPEIDR
jgi:hypothetical protein